MVRRFEHELLLQRPLLRLLILRGFRLIVELRLRVHLLMFILINIYVRLGLPPTHHLTLLILLLVLLWGDQFKCLPRWRGGGANPILPQSVAVACILEEGIVGGDLLALLPLHLGHMPLFWG